MLSLVLSFNTSFWFIDNIVNSYELRYLEFPRIPEAELKEYSTVYAISGLCHCPPLSLRVFLPDFFRFSANFCIFALLANNKSTIS
jgi:hypothetical protein